MKSIKLLAMLLALSFLNYSCGEEDEGTDANAEETAFKEKLISLSPWTTDGYIYTFNNDGSFKIEAELEDEEGPTGEYEISTIEWELLSKNSFKIFEDENYITYTLNSSGAKTMSLSYCGSDDDCGNETWTSSK